MKTANNKVKLSSGDVTEQVSKMLPGTLFWGGTGEVPSMKCSAWDGITGDILKDFTGLAVDLRTGRLINYPRGVYRKKINSSNIILD